jgi:hypothetical protein
MSFVRFGVRKFLIIDGGVLTHGAGAVSKLLDNELELR